VVEKTPKTTGDSESQNTPKSAKNKEVTATGADDQIPSDKPSTVPTEDKGSTKKVTCSDKLDNKLTDLDELEKSRPELPDHIKAAITALIQTHKVGEE